MIRGIDVSKWQKEIDWNEAKKDDVNFAIIRAGYGNGNMDPYAHMNCVKCNSLVIPVGLYWFSYAYTEDMARREAHHALNFASKHKIELPIYFDFEYDSDDYARAHGINVSRETFCRFTEAFCKTIEQGGYYAAFYCNRDYLRNKVSDSLRSRFDMWLADYSQPVLMKDSHMVQYTDSGFIHGINGKVDLNLTDRDYPTIIRNAGLNKLNEKE